MDQEEVNRIMEAMDECRKGRVSRKFDALVVRSEDYDKPMMLSRPGVLLQKSDGNHPLTFVANDIHYHYGFGWSESEDLVIRVEESMKRRGWTVIPPNSGIGGKT